TESQKPLLRKRKTSEPSDTERRVKRQVPPSRKTKISESSDTGRRVKRLEPPSRKRKISESSDTGKRVKRHAPVSTTNLAEEEQGVAKKSERKPVTTEDVNADIQRLERLIKKTENRIKLIDPVKNAKKLKSAKKTLADYKWERESLLRVTPQKAIEILEKRIKSTLGYNKIRAKRGKEYGEKNKGKVKESVRASEKKNREKREKINARRREWVRRNKEKVYKQNSEWRKKKRKKIKKERK